MIGIGLNNPSVELDVTGSSKISGNLTTQGTIDIDQDDTGLFFGESQDAKIEWDTSGSGDLLINSENVTASDEVHFTNFDLYKFDDNCQLGDANTENHSINTAPVVKQMLTADFADATANSNTRFIDGTMADSGGANVTGTTNKYGYYLDFDISGNIDTDGGPPAIQNVYGTYVDMDSTSVIAGTAAGYQTLYGNFANLEFAGTLGGGDVTEEFKAYGAFYDVTGKASGEPVGENSVWGIYANSNGNLGTLGPTAHYGSQFVVSGTAGNNYGGWFSASGGTNNWGIWVNAGDVALDNDSQKILFGEEQDVSIYFDNADLIINSENITASDEIHFTNFDKYTFDAPLEITSTTSQVGLYYDGGNLAFLTVNSGGDLTISASGGDIDFADENLLTSGTINSGDISTSEDVNLVQGKRLNLEGSGGDTYFTYNGTSVQLYVNNVLVREWSN
jgi:hypothetical protein